MRLQLTSGELRKWLLLVIILGMIVPLRAQSMPIMSGDSSFAESQSMLELRTELDYRSNRLTNEFTDKFIFGGEINEELKNDIENNGSEKFRFGGNAFGGFRFFNFADTLFKRLPKLGLMVNASSHWHARGSFSENFYELAMYGNRPLAGSTQFLEVITAEYLAWQQAGVGLFHKPTLSFVSVDVINGQSFSSFNVPSAALYTATDGAELTFGVTAEMSESDTLLSGFGVSNGVGSVINARINLPLKEKRGFVSLEVSNLGFINWNKYTINRNTNNAFSYSGVDLAEVFSDENEVEFPNLQDSLFEETSLSEHTTFLPGRLSATVNHRIFEKGFYTIGIDFIPVSEYVPLGRVGYSHFLGDRVIAGVIAEYGGFGNFRAGASFQWWSQSNWYLQLRINDVPGLFLADAKGRGAQLVISKFFKSRDDRERTKD